MADIFSGLDSLGLDKLEDIPLFKEDCNNDGKSYVEEEKERKEDNILKVLYNRTVECPICDNKISERTVRSGKLKLLKTDLDLRPIYNILDPMLYDVHVCNRCGYAALSKTFKQITPLKAKLLKEKVSRQFRGTNYPDIYTYDIAIQRYKLALYDATVMLATDIEKAYLCLKLAWLYRGYKEEALNKKEIQLAADCKKNEAMFIDKTYEGFEKAYRNDRLPAMGLDELTLQFLLGELARRRGDYKSAVEWLQKVIISNGGSRRLKNRARESKELVKQALHRQKKSAN